jgi:dedicator of cytokinesis protein 3
LFVYRGLEYELISTFTQRLQTEFPTAQIYQKQARPGREIMDSNEQYIQIGNIRPIADTTLLHSAMHIVPDKIAKFYKVNDVTKFKHDRPVHKGTVDKNNEFKTLWIERTILEINTPLPNILRWFEVKSEPKIRELTPVEVACETMENTIKELQELSNQYKSDDKGNLNPFTMRLQGTIDANVQGGIPKYQDAFLSDVYKRSPEGKENLQYIQKLQHLILELLSVLEKALDLHGKLAPPEIKPLHESLVERLQKIRESVVGLSRSRYRSADSVGSIVNTPLPPLPLPTKSIQDYEPDELYTPIRNTNGFRNSLEISDLKTHVEAPPVPLRISKTDFNSPEVPPKIKENAPPLPPRGCTPDSKRSSNPLLFGNSFDSQNKRIPYSVVDIPVDDPDVELHQNPRTYCVYERDSGISTSSQEINSNLPDSNSTNSLPYPAHSHSHSHLHHPANFRGHHKTSSNPEVLNPQDFMEMTVTTIQTSTIHTIQSFQPINSNESSPPKIPPKSIRAQSASNAFVGYDDDESFTNLSSQSTSPPLPPIPTQFRTVDEDGESMNNNYCVPKQIPCQVDNSVNLPCEDEECEDDCYCDNPPESCCNNK